MSQVQTVTEMEMTIARLTAQLAAANKPKKMSLKVSAKGAISVYGFGKWPVTLYKQQMQRLLAGADDIQAFIAANEALLAVKE